MAVREGYLRPVTTARPMFHKMEKDDDILS